MKKLPLKRKLAVLALASIVFAILGLCTMSVGRVSATSDNANNPLLIYKTVSTVSSVSISADGNYTVAGTGSRVYLFSKNSSTPLWNYLTGNYVSAVSISSDGSYIAAGGGVDYKVYLFSKNSGAPLWSYNTNEWVSAVSISSDGSYIVAGSSSAKVYLFSRTSSTPLWSYTIGGYIVDSVSISSDGSYIVAGNNDKKVYLFSKDSSTPLWSYTIGGRVYSVSISADGNYITAGSFDKNVYLFSKADNTPLWSSTTNDYVESVSISADGNYITAGSWRNVYLFSKADNTPLWSSTTNNWVSSVSISSDGSYIVAGSSGANVYFFSKNSSTPLWSYNTNNEVWSVSISSDGSYVAAGNPVDNRVYLFYKEITLNIPPTASFAYSPSSPTTDNTIQFTDQSTDNGGTIVSWYWDFGDGATSTIKNPTHKYSNAGTYSVTLAVTDNGGASNTENKSVTVTRFTKITISPPSFELQSGQFRTLTATLTDNANNPLANKTIVWSTTAGNLSPTSGTTNSSGQVSVTYTAPTVTTQTSVTVTASFAGDNQYQASNTSSSGTIRPFGEIIITTVEELQAIKDNLSAHYALGNDIDASATASWNGGLGFEPIGTLVASFTGSFDGGGHKISNLYINRGGTQYVGLFGVIGASSVVENAGLENENVRGKNWVGGLVGYNLGTLSNSCSTGSVSGSSHVGGLIGYNSYLGTVSNSYSICSISGSSEMGGLVGYNGGGAVSNSYSTGGVSGAALMGGLVGVNVAGTVSNCYSTGSASGTGSYVGGLVGYVNGGTVSNCYSTGSISGSSAVGGLVGSKSEGATVSNSFWDNDTSGTKISAGGTWKTTENMKYVRTYTDTTWSTGLTAPWDFVDNPYYDTGNEDIWDIDSAINNGYPFLTTFMEALPRTATTLSIFPSTFTLQSGGSTTLTATLKDNANNPLVNETITWTKTAGILTPTSGTTNSSGQVSVTYTAPTVTTQTSVTVTASFAGDNQYESSSGNSYGTITAENVVTIPTTLVISPSTFTLYPGENQTFIATLRDENNNALANKTIIWDATAGTLSASSGTTNSSGWTSVSYTAPQVTSQTAVTVSAYFIGDSQYQASYDSSEGTVLPQPSTQPTSLSISPSAFALFPGYSGQVQSLTATLKDNNYNSLSNKTITWSATAGSVSPSSGTTNALGQVSVVYTAPTVTAETPQLIITASFADDTQYQTSSGTSWGIPAILVGVNIPASTGGTVVINVVGINVTVNVLIVPPNALPEDTAVTVMQAPHENISNYKMVSHVFDVGPSGMTFTTPSTLTLPYDENELPVEVSEDDLAIYYYNTDMGSWERVGGNVNKVDKTVSAQVNHLSKYAVMVELAELPAAPQVEGGIPLIAVILAVLGVSAAAAASSAWIYIQRTRGEATSKLIEHGLHNMSLREADIFREIREKKEFSLPELMQKTGASKTIVWRTVQKLIKKRLVEPTKKTIAPAAGRGKPSTVYKYVGD